jgi:hypothetical protein
MNINYLKHDEIDFKKWDLCIKRAVNGSVFGYSWFLNIVSPKWDALVDDNYENVMPMTHKKYLGIRMLMQPCLAPNLGVYSSKVLDSSVVKAFIEAIPQSYRFVNIRLNKHNKFSEKRPKTLDGVHFELDLIEDYYKIRSRFSSEIRLGLSIASEQKISIIPGLNSNSLLQLIHKNAGLFKRMLFRKRYAALANLVSTAVRFRIGKIYGAYTSDNKLCAAAFFIYSHQRFTLLVSVVPRRALKLCAYEAIIDEFIRTHAEESLTLRFEYASRNRFGNKYRGFGAKPFRFVGIKINRLKSVK